MFTWLAESCPNWLKPLPGLLVLGIAALTLLGPVIWTGGFIFGSVLLLVGLATMKVGKGSGYNF
jgi:hypothetical protein